MLININKSNKIPKRVDLSESEQVIPGVQQIKTSEIDKVNTDTEQDVLRIKSKQFEFSCGVTMANIYQPINTPFGLKYHYDNTDDFESFLESVEKFIKTSENVLSDSDIKKLETHYVKKFTKDQQQIK